MDRIALTGMVFNGRHGVRDTERSHAQSFTVDIEVETSVSRAGRTDHIADTVDYRELRSIARDVIGGPSVHLIEALAERIAARALELKGVRAVSVRVAKRPVSMRPIDSAAVAIRRARRR